jgi:hypothetical protein
MADTVRRAASPNVYRCTGKVGGVTVDLAAFGEYRPVFFRRGIVEVQPHLANIAPLPIGETQFVITSFLVIIVIDKDTVGILRVRYLHHAHYPRK